MVRWKVWGTAGWLLAQVGCADGAEGVDDVDRVLPALRSELAGTSTSFVPAVVFHQGMWLQAAELEVKGEFPEAFELGPTAPPVDVLASTTQPVVQGVISTAVTLGRIEIPVVDSQGSCSLSGASPEFSFVTRTWTIKEPLPAGTACTFVRKARVPGATASDEVRCVDPPVGPLGPETPGCELVEQQGDQTLLLDPFQHFRGMVEELRVIYVKTRVPSDSWWPFALSVGRALEPGYYLLEPHPISAEAMAEGAACERKRLRDGIDRYNQTSATTVALDTELARLPRSVADAIRRDIARNGPSCRKVPFRLVEGWSGRTLRLAPDATVSSDRFVW